MMTIDITLILAIFFTIFTCMLIPIYWKNYGTENFLWLSDVGLFMTVIMLWLHSSLLNSMAIIGIMPLEIIWTIDYFYRLISGNKLLNVTDYMFDKKNSLFLRSLSLFHLALPVIWIYYLYAWGYHHDAPVCQTVLTWVVLLITYCCTDPDSNINWVFLPEKHGWNKVSARLWLLVLLCIFPLFLIWPMHFLIHFLTTN